MVYLLNTNSSTKTLQTPDLKKTKQIRCIRVWDITYDCLFEQGNTYKLYTFKKPTITARRVRNGFVT